MRTVKRLFFMSLGLLSGYFVNAQDSLSLSDAVDMRIKAEGLVSRELKELLDNISTNESNQNTRDVITGSHSGTINRIFLSSKVIVQDDINPSFKSSATSTEVTIDKYLSDFDLFYKKTPTTSVFFNDFHTSHIKRVNDNYVKVYFKSLFKSQNKYSDTAYTENNRVAEVHFVKRDKTWMPYIANLLFFNPADTANDFLNDVVLMREKGELNDAMLTDSARNARIVSFEADLVEKRKKQLEEEYEKNQANYNRLMKEGEVLLDQSDFTGATKAFTDARDLKPGVREPLIKLDNVRRKQEAATVKKSDLYNQYVSGARGKVRKRLYKEALELYQRALEQKPENAPNIEADISALTKKYRILSKLEDKYNAGQYKEVIKDCKDAIKQSRDEAENSDYYLFMARCYDKMLDTKEALKNFNKSYDADNDNLEAIEGRAILFKKLKDYVSASADYKSYVLLAKDNVKIFEELADLRMLINNNPVEAIKFLDEGLRSNEISASLYLKKGLFLMIKNDLEEASKNFTSAIRIDSTNAFVFYNRGKSQYGLKHFKNAVDDFHAARNLALDSANVAKIDSLAEILSKKSTEKFNLTAIDSALYYISYAIDINPFNETYRYKKGEYLFSVDKFKEAISNYDEGLRIMHNYTDCFFKRGLSYLKLKDYNSAIRDLKSADSLNHMLYQVARYLGDSYYAISDFSNASVNYENSLKIISAKSGVASLGTEAEIFNLLGKTYFKVGDFEKALSSFKSSIRKNPGLALAYYNRGLTYYKTNDLRNATEDMSKAVSLRGSDPEWFYSLASTYQAKKEYQKAAESYDHCIKLDSFQERIDAVYNRGYCYYQLQNWNEALKDYDRCRRQGRDTGISVFDYQLGIIYLNISKIDSAYNCFYRAYIKDTTDAMSMYNLARALYAGGKADESLVWFDKSFQKKVITRSDVRKEAFWEDKKFAALRKKYF